MRYLSAIFTLLLALAFTGCTDDMLLPDGAEGQVKPGDPLTLTFTVGVPSMAVDGEGGSRAGTRAIYYGNPTYYEDWIDTQDGLRVLFFLHRRAKAGSKAVAGQYDDDNDFVAVDPKNPLKDYFLFESTSRWVTQLPYDDDNNLRYQVTVPVYQIGNEEAEYRDHWDKIRELLRTYDFKIAILANHPAETFKWTFENSVLAAPDIEDLTTASTKLKTINDIHHSVPDNQYSNGGSGRADGYSMLVDSKNKINGLSTMGPFIDCVIMRSDLYGDALGGTFNNRETARNWIRDYWRPALKYNDKNEEDYEMLYHDFRNLWSYWNFGGSAPDNGWAYSQKSRTNSYIGQWEERNGALLRGIITEAAANGGTLPEISTKPQGDMHYDAALPLTLHPSGAKATIVEGTGGKRFYGITLPKISDPSSTDAKDCFSFTMQTKGTVTVSYIDNGGTVKAKFTNQTVNPTTTKTVNGQKVTVCEFYYGLSSTNTCYIYSSAGNPTILDIEFVEDEYVYLTDREGILPSSDHPIPMYGVQKYDRLQGFWDEGASFDLTSPATDVDGTPYNPKTIFLLRAVAKVECLIPKSLGVPRHVYMRSLNRNARCEPMDVGRPTEQLWKDHDTECEWIMIQKRGTFYVNGSYSKEDYKKKLVWYFGTWREWGWNFNGQTQYVPADGDGPFPRLMNPYINRSDFAAFIDITDYYNDQYYHFIFYMGENTLDASSTYNGDGGSAQVPHIEIRFDERYKDTSKLAVNSTHNLDDGDCYRIYFTEGGIASGARDANGVSKIPKGDYQNSYEKNSTYLKEHWPIIRNHVYRFTVRDAVSDNMNGLVVDAQNRSVDFNFQ